MTRHGISHAGATLVTVIVAPLLVEFLRPKLPELVVFTERVAQALIAALALGPRVSVGSVTSMLVAGGLAFLWGAAFAIADR